MHDYVSCTVLVYLCKLPQVLAFVSDALHEAADACSESITCLICSLASITPVANAQDSASYVTCMFVATLHGIWPYKVPYLLLHDTQVQTHTADLQSIHEVSDGTHNAQCTIPPPEHYVTVWCPITWATLERACVHTRMSPELQHAGRPANGIDGKHRHGGHFTLLCCYQTTC